MAFKVLAPPDTELRVLYNVSKPVGPKQPNREEDVLLVQFCLQKLFDNPDAFNPPFPPPPNRKRIETDGKCGPLTQAGILHFQNVIKSRHASIRPDGVVNRANDRTVVSPISHTVFTIVFLNKALKGVIGDDLFGRLESDPEVPFKLALSLSTSAD